MISIIVPVYNVENYLDRCVRSICEQSYTDLEIILVDDGSTDSSGEICDKWTEKDCRIKAVHKSNGGLSDARNIGLKNATGDYIAFIDSDDWIEKDYCLTLLNTITEKECDIAGCKFRRTSDNSTVSDSKETVGYSCFKKNEEIMRSLIYGKINCIVCNKLYKRTTVYDVLFPFGKQHEDDFWTYKVFFRINKYVECDYIGYNYFKNPTSIMGRKYSLKRLDQLEAKCERADFVETHYPDLINIALIDVLDSCIFHSALVNSLNKKDKKTASTILKNTYKKYFSRLKKKEVPIKKLLLLYIARISFTLCIAILGIKKGELS